MASLTITAVVLNLVSDPSVAIVLGPDQNMNVEVSEDDLTMESECVTASGRILATTEPGNPRRVTVRAEFVDRTTREQLQDYKGSLFCYRDWDGRLIFGTWASLAITAQPGNVSDISFVFNQRTYSIVD